MRTVSAALISLVLTACSDGGAQMDAAKEEPEVASSSAVLDALEKQRAALERAAGATASGGAYAYTFAGLVHDEIPMAAFAGQPVLVVNTASKCGYTPQYKDLQALYESYEEEGLVVLGVPSNDFGGQEPGSAEEIEEFCRLNFGVTFPMTQKYVVQGPDAHPFYQWAEENLGKTAVPQWNFHKILIGRDGLPARAFPSGVGPMSSEITNAVKEALAQPAPPSAGD